MICKLKSLYRHLFLEDISKHARVTKKWHFLIFDPASSQHHNSGGGGGVHQKKSEFIRSQLRVLATHTPILGRQGINLAQIRKCHF